VMAQFCSECSEVGPLWQQRILVICSPDMEMHFWSAVVLSFLFSLSVSFSLLFFLKPNVYKSKEFSQKDIDFWLLLKNRTHWPTFLGGTLVCLPALGKVRVLQRSTDLTRP
jgi:hypothetical protein